MLDLFEFVTEVVGGLFEYCFAGVDWDLFGKKAKSKRQMEKWVTR